MQYCATEDFFLKLFKNSKFEHFEKKYEDLQKIGKIPPPVADPEIFISGGPLTDLRGGPLQSRFSYSLYKQPNFFPKRGGPGPLGPPKSASAHPFYPSFGNPLGTITPRLNPILSLVWNLIVQFHRDPYT